MFLVSRDRDGPGINGCPQQCDWTGWLGLGIPDGSALKRKLRQSDDRPAKDGQNCDPNRCGSVEYSFDPLLNLGVIDGLRNADLMSRVC